MNLFEVIKSLKPVTFQPEIIPGCFEIKVVTDRVVLPTILSKDADGDQINEVTASAKQWLVKAFVEFGVEEVFH